MKITTFFIMLLVSITTKTSYRDGISFFEGSVKEALATAQQEKKPVFVYVYADWCGVCKKLKKSFKDKEAGAYYNKNFINIAVDGETEEGSLLLQKYAVKSYPTLLILDGTGKLQTRTTGYHTPYLLMNFGKRVVPK